VNATLPIETPDFVLLAMVENHASQACGRPCAPGEPDQSRCVPSAIITATSGPRTNAVSDSLAGAQPPPLEGRMALAGPKTELPEAGALSPATDEITKAAPRVDRQRRDRQRNRSAASKSLPAWAIPRAMP
jgi:hypothetical protein